MNKIEELIEKLHVTKDISVLSELNRLGVKVAFLEEGIRWSYK